METRRNPKTDGHDAWRVLKVLEASQRSLSMNGEPVPVDAVRAFGSASRLPEFAAGHALSANALRESPAPAGLE